MDKNLERQSQSSKSLKKKTDRRASREPSNLRCEKRWERFYTLVDPMKISKLANKSKFSALAMAQRDN